GRGGKVLPFAQRLGGGGGKAVSCPAGVDLLAGGSGREVQGHFGGAGEHHASFGGRHRYCFAAPLPAQQVPGGECGVEFGPAIGERGGLAEVRGDDGTFGHRCRSGKVGIPDHRHAAAAVADRGPHILVARHPAAVVGDEDDVGS